MVEAIAAGLGHALRVLLIFLRMLPGLVGPLVVVYGFWLAWPPLGFIVAGVILIAADLRIGRIGPIPEAGK